MGKYNGTYLEIVRENIDIPKSELQIKMEEIEAEKQRDIEAKKLAMDVYSETIVSEQNKEEMMLIEMFDLFKRTYKIPSHYTIEFVRDNVSDFDNVFTEFIKEQEEAEYEAECGDSECDNEFGD